MLSGLTIAQENQLAGTPQSQWDVSGNGDPSIQGFATDISVNVGQTESFKINDTASAAYTISIYRMGYYQGNGARLVASLASSQTLRQVQPAPITNATTGLTDAGNWAVSASWAVPAAATSGVYFADITRTDTGGASQLFFVVRNDASTSDILVKTSDATWEAYNAWFSGNSLYGGSSLAAAAGGGAYANRAVAVSYNRPLMTRGTGANPFYVEYPMIRFLEQNGYDVSYFTDVDTDLRGNEILQHKVFMSVGHDEYWSGNEFANVQAARNAGVNVAFLGGNAVYWKTFYTSSSLNTGGTTTTDRVLVCYKESWSNAVIHPNEPNVWTGMYADPRFSPPADGGTTQNTLTGGLSMVDQIGTQMYGQGASLTVPAVDASLRIWRNTSVAALQPGQVATLGQNVLGSEFDEDVDNGFRPAGEIDLSLTTLNVTQLLYDYGSTIGPGVATHSLAEYRAASGALVFDAGTIQWSFALDGHHDGPASATDINLQQATVNVLADMHVFATTLMAGLVAPSASTDTTPPTSSITSPAGGTTVTSGTPVTFSGTASDVGGVVAGVEVSTDGGATWHPATGTTNWTYTWTPGATGPVNLACRATDDSANLQTTAGSLNLTVNPPGRSLTIITTDTPGTVADADSGAVELGVRFKSDLSGSITGIRFYKSSTNAGAHVGNLWTASGTLLATATFTSETASAWQQVDFSQPVAITAGTIYVASYHTNVGHYSDDLGSFAGQGIDNGPLHAVQDMAGSRNGLYSYSDSTTFPKTPSPNSVYYWVDLVFSPGGTSSNPGSFWSNSTTPTVPAVNDPGAVNLGMKFQSSAAGTITGVRFYKGLTNTGTHIGYLWNAAGALLASVTFTNETASGWQQANFSSAVAINANTTYIVSYFAPNGNYADDAGYFATGFSSGTLTAPASGTSGGNGVYAYGTGTIFPTQTYQSTNYWVDVVYNSTAASLGLSAQSPAPNAAGVLTTAPITATFNQDITASTLSFTLRNGATIIPATLSYNASTLTATLQPNSPLALATTYTATVSASDTSGNAMAPVSWSFTTANGSSFSLFSPATVPAAPTTNDPSQVQVGMQLQSTVAGNITAIRFYKGSGNTGTHIGYLWSSTGALLATVTFTNETASGWQQATLSTPLAISPNTTYIVSYYAPSGHYAADQGAFNSPISNSPLTGLGSVYVYSSAAVFPTQTYLNTNYYVDVVFNPT